MRTAKRNTFIFSLLLVLSGTTSAFDKDKWGYGVYAKGGSYTVGDPSGDVDSTFSTNFGGKIMFYPDRRGHRVFFALEAGGFNLDADAGEGLNNAEVSTFGAQLGYERRFNISRDFKLWLGGALNAGTTKVENRYSLASDGFLDTQFKDRDDSNVGFSLYLDTYFDVTEEGDIQIGIGPYYDIQSNDGIESGGLKITLQRK